MKLLALDRKKGIAKLTVENLDDLWHLYNLISKGDIVHTRTTRMIKIDRKEGRPTEGRRIKISLTLKVTEVFFDKNANRLRVRGVVLEAPERYEGIKGSFHTLSIAPRDILTVVKGEWTSYLLKRIRQACEVKVPPVILISIDDEDICIAKLERFGVDVKFDKKIRLPGKLEPDKRKDATHRYFAEVTHALKEARKDVEDQIVVLGPGFVKNEFANYLRDNLKLQPPPQIHICQASSAGIGGIYEALRSGVLSKIIRECRIIQEVSLVERFFNELAMGKRTVTYGLDEIETATRYGAVQNLIVVDKYFREVEGEEKFKLENAMREVEKKRGEVTMISAEHEGGEKVMSLGGAAAILRFAV